MQKTTSFQHLICVLHMTIAFNHHKKVSPHSFLVNGSSSIHILGTHLVEATFILYGPQDKNHMDLIYLSIYVDLISIVVQPFPSWIIWIFLIILFVFTTTIRFNLIRESVLTSIGSNFFSIVIVEIEQWSSQSSELTNDLLPQISPFF